MYKQDVLFKTSTDVFSLRTAGILIHNDKILLQRVPPDSGYAYPGGHVELGETTEHALQREFLEEIDARISIKRLLWVGELFFPWGEKKCHQISYYYLIELENNLPRDKLDTFYIYDILETNKIKLEFSWISMRDIQKIVIYPENTQKMLCHLSEKVETFVYFE
jgi:ADP-ribose pyrophosphatase YjhB (NUDIX family)